MSKKESKSTTRSGCPASEPSDAERERLLIGLAREPLPGRLLDLALELQDLLSRRRATTKSPED